MKVDYALFPRKGKHCIHNIDIAWLRNTVAVSKLSCAAHMVSETNSCANLNNDESNLRRDWM